MFNPDNAVDLVNLASLTERDGFSVALSERAYAIAPDQLAVKIAHAVALQNAGEFERAIPVFQAALVQNNTTAEGGQHVKKLLIELLVYALIATGQRDLARKVLAANRPMTDTAEVFAQAHALLGDFAKGFALYGSDGTMLQGTPAEQIYRAKKWKGEDLSGKRAVVVRGAGFGDYFMMGRFFHLLKDRFHAKSLVLCGDGASTRQEHFAIWPFVKADDVITFDDIRADDIIVIDHQNLWEGITNKDAFALADYQYLKTATFTKTLEKRAPFNVGLVWQGNPGNNMDHYRSLRLRDLAPLFAVPATAFYSLQADGQKAINSARMGAFITDLMSNITCWRDTMDYLCQLDLLISVDSSVNHIAGAMGVPTIVLNHRITDWRYVLDNERTMWHKNHFVCWQKEQGNWTHCVHRARDVLAKAVENKLNEPRDGKS